MIHQASFEEGVGEEFCKLAINGAYTGSSSVYPPEAAPKVVKPGWLDSIKQTWDTGKQVLSDIPGALHSIAQPGHFGAEAYKGVKAEIGKDVSGIGNWFGENKGKILGGGLGLGALALLLSGNKGGGSATQATASAFQAQQPARPSFAFDKATISS